jgi:hypothetical protein
VETGGFGFTMLRVQLAVSPTQKLLIPTITRVYDVYLNALRGSGGRSWKRKAGKKPV